MAADLGKEREEKEKKELGVASRFSREKSPISSRGRVWDRKRTWGRGWGGGESGGGQGRFPAAISSTLPRSSPFLSSNPKVLALQGVTHCSLL